MSAEREPLIVADAKHYHHHDSEDDSSGAVGATPQRSRQEIREEVFTQNQLREREELKAAETSMFQFVSVFAAKVRAMPCTQLLFISLLVALLTVGNAMQLIGINFWLGQFADGNAAGSFTILMMSGLVFAIVFTAWWLVYIFVKKPDTHFMRDKKGWWLLFGVGANDTLNSFMAIYAANYTPEVLQALFQTLLPVYACVMSKYVLKDPRTYLNRWIIISFVLITAGVVIAAVPNFSGGGDSSSNIGWSVVFFMSVPFTALQYVWQAKYMIDYTIEPKIVLPEDEEDEGGIPSSSGAAGKKAVSSRSFRSAGGGVAAAKYATQSRFRLDDGLPNPPSPQEEGADNASSTSTSQHKFVVERLSSAGATDIQNTTGVHAIETSSGVSGFIGGKRPYRGEDTIVKLTMLFGDVGMQLVLSFMLLPADALPWWGGANTIDGAWKHFSDGTREIFTNKDNFFYCAVYSGGYVMQYISAAYLNHYSATLSTMVGQLSSPITAIALIIIPSWDVTPGNGAWYWSAIAVLLLTVGTVIYSAWEEMSSQELVLEMQAKERERRKAIKEGIVASVGVNNAAI